MLTIRPPAPRAHAWQDGLGAQKRRFQVDRDPEIEILLADAADRDAGVVHQHVDRAQFACDARRHLGDLRADGYVRTDCDRPSAGGADLRDDGVSLLGARLKIDRNLGGALGQPQRDRPANAARGARDEGDPPLKINHIHPLTGPTWARRRFV
jgi:hypothetical protein